MNKSPFLYAVMKGEVVLSRHKTYDAAYKRYRKLGQTLCRVCGMVWGGIRRCVHGMDNQRFSAPEANLYHISRLGRENQTMPKEDKRVPQ